MRSPFGKLSTAALAILPFVIATPLPLEQPSKTVEKRAVSSLVNGSPMGFASGTTGGGNASPVYPSTIAQLKSYLTDSSPRVIVISGTFNFAGSEGTVTYGACNSYSCTPENGGQALLNTLNGCGSSSIYNVNIDKAAYTAINVQSNKSLIGKNGATLNGKGLRFQGVENVIIQNIAITNLNPKYVWGGDAIAVTDSKNIWIDHVTTSLLGRQHYSFGQGASKGVTISNSFINGKTTNSATCNQRSYWGLELVGSSDEITFYRNRVSYTSGRSPALSGSTLFHAVNNVWDSNDGHLLEGDSNGKGLYEGNYFIGVATVEQSGSKIALFTSNAADVSKCSSYIGRNCVSNAFENSGTLSGSDTSVLTAIKGKTIVDAASARSIVTSVTTLSGNTL